MTTPTGQARQEMLDTIAAATDEIGRALGVLGEAYEQLDEANADRLEEALFRPVQAAFGRARRTHDGFAARFGLAARPIGPGSSEGTHGRPAELVDRAVEIALDADEELSLLQDSMMPVELGDAELRAGLAEVRTHLGEVERAGRGFLRTLGR